MTLKPGMKRLRLALNLLRGRPTIAFVQFAGPIRAVDCNHLMVHGCRLKSVEERRVA